MIGVVSAEDIDRYAGIPVTWENRKLKKTTDYLKNAQSVIILGFGLWDDICDLATRKNNRWLYPGEMLLSVCQRDLALALHKEGLRVYTGYPFISHKYLAILGGIGSMGKNSMIITRQFGPQVRFRCLITDTILEYDQPVTENLCGDCNKCLTACPTGALSEYKVDQQKCLVGQHIAGKHPEPERLAGYEPQITPRSHIMCRECQKACPYSKFQPD